MTGDGGDDTTEDRRVRFRYTYIIPIQYNALYERLPNCSRLCVRARTVRAELSYGYTHAHKHTRTIERGVNVTPSTAYRNGGSGGGGGE